MLQSVPLHDGQAQSEAVLIFEFAAIVKVAGGSSRKFPSITACLDPGVAGF